MRPVQADFMRAFGGAPACGVCSFDISLSCRRTFTNPLNKSQLDSKAKIQHVLDACCYVKAECPFCSLRGSSVYVHESCCLGVQRHLFLPTAAGKQL